MFFISPMIVTLLSALFLKENVGLRRWSAVLVGFAGVLIIVRPGSGLLDPVSLLPIVAALAYASSQIIARRIGKTQTGASLAFSSMVVFVGVSALAGALIGDGMFAGAAHPSIAFLLGAWSVPGAFDALLIVVCGLIAAAGFYFLSQGYRIAPASVVAPFEFVAMPLAMFWGILIWAEYPSPLDLAGHSVDRWQRLVCAQSRSGPQSAARNRTRYQAASIANTASPKMAHQWLCEALRR